LRSLKKDNRGKKGKVNGGQGVLEEFVVHVNIIGDGTGIEEKSRSN
jgi:hypothetical protein